jgi:hypothetical protein
MVKCYNGAGFGWYFTKTKIFGGIFLKSGSFDGTEPIFPSYVPENQVALKRENDKHLFGR